MTSRRRAPLLMAGMGVMAGMALTGGIALWAERPLGTPEPSSAALAPSASDASRSQIRFASSSLQTEAGSARPGFPERSAAGDRKRWSDLVEREISDAADLAAGTAWTNEARTEVVGALRRLRDANAEVRRTRVHPDSSDAIRAGQRHRSAARAADAVSRRTFGVPLAEFLLLAQPGVIEEVPPG